jgi:hypothetical protein
VAAIARVSSLLTTEAAHTRGFCVFGVARSGAGRRFEWKVLLLAVVMVCFVRGLSGQEVAPQKIAEGVWF